LEWKVSSLLQHSSQLYEAEDDRPSFTARRVGDVLKP